MEFFQTLICILLVAWPSFVITKNIKGTISRLLIVSISTIILYPFLYIASGYWISNIATSLKMENVDTFEKAKWIASKKDRYRYSLYIDTSYLLTKKTSSEVINLLGEPDFKKEDFFQYKLAAGSWRNKYGFNPWLGVEFRNDTAYTHYTVWDD